MKDKKGFTLAELLVVVAIVAVPVAISIPIFSAQIKKARIATNQANIRSAKSATATDYLANHEGEYTLYVYDIDTGKLVNLSEFGMTGGVCFSVSQPVYQTYSNVFRLKVAANKDNLDNGKYKRIVVSLSPDGIKTSPYYDKAADEIKTDTYK